MMYNWQSYSLPLSINFALCFLALFAGSLTDLKKREVPDWVNYGLIIAGVALNLLFSVIYWTPRFIINSVVGLLVFFGIAWIMFYAGQWGGGDSKMLMGLGSVIGIDVTFKFPQFLAAFLINSLFVGAIYGLFWSFLLVFRNKRKFLKTFKKKLSVDKIKHAKKFILVFVIITISLFFIINDAFMKILLLSFAFLILTTFYLFIFVKAVEKSCMHKQVEPSRLTEGDWIVKDIIVGGKYITGPKDLGISKGKIKKLVEFYRRGKVRKVLIKEGIPFVPSFLLAFLLTLFFGDILFLIFR